MDGPAAQRIGGYRLLTKLAVGGMAEIFLARLEGAHGFTKHVVLKRMLPHLCDDPAFVDMFLHEARIAARLNHPNIAQVFDIGEHEGRVYFTMEYVDGLDLRAIAKQLARRGPPPLAELLAILSAAAAGLHHAHELRDDAGRSLGLVHRDVTPSNVMVTFGGVAKLLDFGVAKASVEGRESTAVGVLKGKLPYMSPEQADGGIALDRRSDVFSLGVVLWELTTFRRLFRSSSQVEIIRMITQQDAPPPSSVRPDYPAQLEAIVTRALARDRERRYQSAFELQQALEQFVLSHGLAIGATGLASFMATSFADELAQEQARIAELERERTDSQVLLARASSPRSPAIAEPEPGDDEPTRVSGAGPVPVAAASVEALLEPDDEPLEPRRRVAARPLVLAAIASVGVVALGLAAWPRGDASDSREVEQAPTSAADRAAPPDAALVAAPPEPSEPPPTSEAEPEPEPELAPEPAPEQPRPKTKRPSKPRKNKPRDDEWNKNSLSLPE